MDEQMYAMLARNAREWGLEAVRERFAGLPDIDAFVERWQTSVSNITSGWPAILAAGHEEWYPGPVERDVYWPALEKHFRASGWGDTRIRGVNESSSKVVAHTPNPQKSPYAARGLVVGYVQSGKTTNFTAVAAKMADVDYQFVVVLSGIHNGLRLQTQERLNEQLVSLNHQRWIKLTDDTDFVKPSATPSALLTGSPNQVALAVVKKNAAVLRRLICWLDTPNGRDALRNIRVLVIDDEADQASVATDSINPLILRLLSLMPRHTYIGYTATPFANVFIDPAGEDLYPRDFILNLPRPEGYFGPEQVFGRDRAEGDDPDSAPDGHDMIRRIEDDHVQYLRPAHREPASDFVPLITTEVRQSLRWFWLATAARWARGDAGKHSTMLIHTSVKTQVHESFFDPLTAEIRRHGEALAEGDERLLSELRQQWWDETSRVRAEDWGRVQNSFEEVVAQLPSVISACRVVLDNSTSEERLDYSGEPVVAIAVGGNTLSRGLTLEGLVVSLFVRGASTYDTLLQMGRWFGYRTGYEDLPRIWTTEELESAFRHLSRVEMEMRDDIDRYQSQNCTPLDLAVRIRTHPLLQVTAKMGAAQPASISYAGHRLQTRYFRRLDTAWIDTNRLAADRLIGEAARQAQGREVTAGRHLVFDGVRASTVKSFLKAYQFHPDQPDLDSTMLCQYIDREILNGTLDTWNVVVIQGSLNRTVQLGPVSVRASVRARVRKGQDDEAAAEEQTGDIKTLMSRRDIGYDLSAPEAQATKTSERELLELRETDPVAGKRGLLVLYAIDRVSAPAADRATSRRPMDAAGDLIGCGILFPGLKTQGRAVKATHLAVDLSMIERPDASEYMDDSDDLGSDQ